MEDKGAADATVIHVNKIIIEGHSEVLIPVSCAIHSKMIIFSTPNKMPWKSIT